MQGPGTRAPKPPPPPASLIVIDKPKGPTSHDVVARLRRTLRTRAIGHCGTLDPMATGVLVVAVEDGTKLVPWLTAAEKAYEATLRFGVLTDSLDADGTETARAPVGAELRAALEQLARDGAANVPDLLARAIAAERSRVLQVPPAISAIRIGGERAHELVRRGETPEMAPREVSLLDLRVVAGGLDPEPFLTVSVHVTKGYFVRSLARDLAEALGTVGHLVALRRTRSGPFTLEDARLVEDVTRELLVPVAEAAARALPTSTLTEEGVVFAGHGKRLLAEHLRDPHPGPSAWLDERGALVAIGELAEDGLGRVLRGFPRAS
ncbi:MAG: tRNA pseudouridine synthase [Labilithrix sp.]|nr:tRNA pseudouridine synthase [Labilithrix sp.]